MKYKDESGINDLVKAFEEATIARDAWKHAEHLVVALHYLNEYDVAAATHRMRDGIFNLLTNGFGVDLSKEMPYHETMTIFWMNTVKDFNDECNRLSLVEKANRLVEVFDKDYPLKYYSRELLFSDRARNEYVEPDLVRPVAEARHIGEPSAPQESPDRDEDLPNIEGSSHGTRG